MAPKRRCQNKCFRSALRNLPRLTGELKQYTCTTAGPGIRDGTGTGRAGDDGDLVWLKPDLLRVQRERRGDAREWPIRGPTNLNKASGGLRSTRCHPSTQCRGH